jgi:hypothetical protein
MKAETSTINQLMELSLKSRNKGEWVNLSQGWERLHNLLHWELCWISNRKVKSMDTNTPRLYCTFSVQT